MTSFTDRQTCATAADLPPIIQADLARPPLERRGWLWTVGPAYAALFIWVPLLDAVGALAHGIRGPGHGLGLLAAAGTLAAMGCYFLLYYAPALLGWKSGQGLTTVAASTLGATGSEWIAGVLVGVGSLIIHSMSISSAVRLTLLGLVHCGLIGPTSLEPWAIGPFVLDSPVFLLTALFWVYIIGLAVWLRLVSVIGAMMQVYTPVALLLLGMVAILTSPGLARLDAPGAPGTAAVAAPSGESSVFQLIFASFAISGLMAAEWGRTLRERRDIRIGGWIAVILAGAFGTTMALLTVAGARGLAWSRQVPSPMDAILIPGTFHWAIARGIGGMTGGILLLLFGLATLAPACYAIWLFGSRMADHWSALRGSSWTWIGGCVSFVLIVTGAAGWSASLFDLLGAMFAPVTGTLAVEAIRTRGAWTGMRRGMNPAGILAWASGLIVGLVPIAGTCLAWPALKSFQPASLCAFATSALVFATLGAIFDRGHDTHSQRHRRHGHSP